MWLENVRPEWRAFFLDHSLSDAVERLLLNTYTCTSLFLCLSFYVQGPADQALLCNIGAVTALLPLLVCNIPRIQHPALQCYASMSFQNGAVSLAMKSGIVFKIVLFLKRKHQ